MISHKVAYLITHPRVVMDVLADAWVDVSAIFIIANARDGVYVDVSVDAVSDISVVGVLLEVIANILELAMTALDFAMPTPRDRSAPFCRATFSCWPMTVLDCDRTLQAWMPSCHVW